MGMTKNSTTSRPSPVRIRHNTGDRLLAADLGDEWSGVAALRGLHVVGLHDTWGIALGFEARLAGSFKSLGKGDPANLLVGPGFAYDYHGREIALAQETVVPVELPSGAGPAPDAPDFALDLVMSYDEELPRIPTGGEPDLCEGEASAERPIFLWRWPGDTRLGLELPLARLIPAKTGPALDLSVRRYAQALARPHIAAGITRAGQPFTPYEADTRSGVTRLGWQLWVDTSEAGFVGAPYYIASLVPGDADLMPGAGPDPLDARAWLFTSVHAAGPTGFYLRAIPAAEFSLTRMLPETIAMRVSWVGVELAGGCRPTPDFRKVLKFLSRRINLDLPLDFRKFFRDI
jgi:hypothetical protein